MKEIIRAIDNKTVGSSLGWTIVISSIDSFQYQEQGKTISFKIEDSPDVTGELEWIIYVPANCRWQNADNEEPISDETMDEIVERINLAFWKLDMKIKEIA
jgi:hypothetical protein